jgi:tRNA(Leu) C34 or U34 (ribose-2'-O)-methylase TrmL
MAAGDAAACVLPACAAQVLSLLDVALEIPQLGIIRSLNVHVSGAIALYECTRQRLAAVAAGAVR